MKTDEQYQELNAELIACSEACEVATKERDQLRADQLTIATNCNTLNDENIKLRADNAALMECCDLDANGNPVKRGATLYLQPGDDATREPMTLKVPEQTKYCWYNTKEGALAAIKSKGNEMKTAEELKRTIIEYLSAGGLFNPEMMEHDKVRDLLIECREALQTQLASHISGMREAARIAVNMPSLPKTVEQYNNCHVGTCEAVEQAILTAAEAKAVRT